MITYLRRIALFWWDFIIGDDWRVAAGVIIALALTAALSAWTSIPTWWLPPAGVLILLLESLHRTIRAGPGA